MATEHDPEVMRICVEAYLAQVRDERADLEGLRWRMADLRELLQGTASPGGAPSASGGVRDRMADGLSRLEALEGEWAEKAARYAGDVEQAAEICAPRHLGRYALYLHIVERMTWQQVGRRISYCDRTARTIAYKSGIPEIYEAMPEAARRDPIPNAQVR